MCLNGENFYKVINWEKLSETGSPDFHTVECGFQGQETWKSCCTHSSTVSPEQLLNVTMSILSGLRPTGTLGSWGENLFILKGAGRNSKLLI